MRTPMLLVTVLAFGCGKKAEHEGSGGSAGTTAVAPAPTEEKGPPPKEAYVGKNRLVNLLVGADGKTQPVDIWVRRGFKWGPVKLAENVAFGTVSPWFGIPEHMSPVALPVGAKPDDKEISPVAYGKADEIVTGVLQLTRGSVGVSSRYEKSKEMQGAPKPPSAGKATLNLDAGQLWNFEKELKAGPIGGSTFNVGDGTGACLPQRDPAMANLSLGGTSVYEVEVPPGKTKITLHAWPGKSGEACKTPPVYEFEVDAVADKAQWVFLYTPDAGKKLATVTATVGE